MVLLPVIKSNWRVGEGTITIQPVSQHRQFHVHYTENNRSFINSKNCSMYHWCILNSKKNTIWWCSPIIANKIRRTKKNRQTYGMMKKYKTTNGWFKSFGAMCWVSNPCCYNTTPLHSADQCLRRRLKLFMWLLPLILGIGLTAARLAAGIWCMLLDMPRIISKGSRKKRWALKQIPMSWNSQKNILHIHLELIEWLFCGGAFNPFLPIRLSASMWGRQAFSKN